MNKVNIKSLTDNELISKTHILVGQERATTAEILQYLAEIESRRLFAQRGFASLWEFATKELKYSAGSAYRRIDAMRLVKSLNADARGDTHAALNDGRLNLSAVNALSRFLKDEKKENQKSYGAADKKDILKKLEGKSKSECERVLVSINPAHAQRANRHVDQTRALSENRTEVCFAMGKELADNLAQIQNLWAHRFKGTPTYEELLLKMSELVLERIDPARKKVRSASAVARVSMVSPQRSASSKAINITSTANSVAVSKRSSVANACGVTAQAATTSSKSSAAPTSTSRTSSTSPASPIPPTAASRATPTNIINAPSTSAVEVKSQTVKESCKSHHALPLSRVADRRQWRPSISVAIKRQVWQRDGGRCTFADAQTGRQCDSTHRLQLDHAVPYCLGGGHSPENLSLKCSAHNSWLAVAKLGRPFMSQFIPGLRR